MKRFWKNISVKNKILIIGIILILSFAVTQFAYFIPTIESNTMDKKKEMVKNLTTVAYYTIKNFHHDFEMGIITEDEAKSRSRYHLRQIRFGSDNMDSFWVNDLTSRGLVHPYRCDLEGKDLSKYKSPNGRLIYKEMSELCKEKHEGYFRYSWQWKSHSTKIVPVVAYVKTFEPWGWIIGTGVYIEDVRAEVRSHYISMGIVSLIIIILAVILLLLSTRSIMNPINELIEGLKESDLNTQLSTQSKDEIGVMAHQFNKFIGNVRDVITTFKESAVSLASSAEEMSTTSLTFSENTVKQSDTTRRVTDNINLITEEMHKITNEIDEEMESLNVLVTGMAKLSDLINKLNQDIKESLKVTETINEIARQGEKSLTEMHDSMDKISRSSQEMQGIIEIINDISEQINLLSLNASIEAARAGDAGRGFAVVADEISKLADQTARSINEISRIISENDREIGKGLNIVDGTVATITKIIEGVDSISNMILNITHRVEEQVGTKENVQNEARNLKEISENISMATRIQMMSIGEITESIYKIKDGTESIASSAEEMASSNEEVAGMAENLKAKIEIFKI